MFPSWSAVAEHPVSDKMRSSTSGVKPGFLTLNLYLDATEDEKFNTSLHRRGRQRRRRVQRSLPRQRRQRRQGVQYPSPVNDARDDEKLNASSLVSDGEAPEDDQGFLTLTLGEAKTIFMPIVDEIFELVQVQMTRLGTRGRPVS